MSVSIDDFANRVDLSLTFETGPVDEKTYTLKGDAALVTVDDRTALAVDNGYAALGKLSSIAAAPAVTVAFDFNRAETTGTATRLFWNDARYGVAINDGRYALMYMGADGKQRTIQTSIGSAPENGVWTSVALVLDSEAGTLRFYVNGTLLLARDGLAMGIASAPVKEATFGGAPRSGSGFTGFVDDLRIWDEALSADQVTRIGESDTPREALIVADDSAAVAAGGTVTIDVLANDDGDGALSVTAVGAPAGGTVTLADGTLTYTALAGFTGVDRFTYTVTDAAGQTASAEVAVTVGSPDPLILTDDSAAVAAGGTVTIDVLANDDGHGTLQIDDVGMPSNGTITLANGALLYRANAGFWGVDRFYYTVTDAFGQTGSAEVTVSVAAPDPLVLTADTATVAARGSVTIDVLANDDGTGALTITDAGAPKGGTVTLTAGALHYQPHAGFAGVDRFTYTVKDAAGQSGSAEVTVTVAAATEGIIVDTPQELMAALKAAKGGETILLAPGDYGRLVIDGRNTTEFDFHSDVTIRSLEITKKASLSELVAYDIHNITFESLLFDHPDSPNGDSIDPFRIFDSSNIEIRYSIFDGSYSTNLSDMARFGYGIGVGLTVRGSSDVAVIGNEFYRWRAGSAFGVVDNLLVSGNVVHSVRSDGFLFASVQGALIEGNTFRDFRSSPTTGDHRDMIQFWTNGTNRPSKDVIIRGNVLDSGLGTETQSIFMMNEEVAAGRAGKEMFYRNIIIEDNIIRNSHHHGITVGEAAGVTIANNTVAHSAATGDGQSVFIPKINVVPASTDVTVIGNYAHVVPNAKEGWTITDNVLIQRTTPGAPGYYGDIFTDGLADHRPAVEALRSYPWNGGTGAPSGAFDTTPALADAFIFAKSGRGFAVGDVGFRIGGVFDADGIVLPAGASIHWDFGDGATSTEHAPTHRYAGTGLYDATVRITLSDGHVVEASKTVQTATPIAVLSNFDAGFADLSALPNGVKTTSGVTLVDGPWGRVAQIPGGTEHVAYGRLPELIGNDSFTVMLDVSKAAATSAGRLVMFPHSFNLSLAQNGISAEIDTDLKSGALKYTTSAMSTTDWHHVALTFSGEYGVATLYLDGKAVSSLGGLSGAVQKGSPSQDLLLGSAWGDGLAGSVDNFVFLRGALSAEQIAAYVASPRPDSPDEFDFGPIVDLTGGPWTDLW